MNQKTNRFIKHPREVGMTYFQHFGFAMNLAKLTFTACFASLVHAVFPFLFVTTTSNITFKLYDLLKSRKSEDNFKLFSMTDANDNESYNTNIKTVC